MPKAFFRRNGKVRYSVYLPEFKRFLVWLEEVHDGVWDPDVLLERRMEDLRSDDIIQRRWVEEQVQRYYKTALAGRVATAGPRRGEPVGEATKQGALTAIASFFKANYVPLTKLNVRKKAARVTRDYWFTTDDVRGMVEIGSALERAYILVMLSLGFRRGDILWLTWMDLWPFMADAGEEEVVGPLDLFTEKHGVVARSFLSPEAVQALRRLRDYQKERGRLGKYVFRNAEDTAFDEGHMNRRLKILFKRAGRVSRGLTVRSHGLRKMLYNELKNEGAPVDVRNMIVGKSVSEDIAAYVNDDELKKWFIKVLPRISMGEPKPESAAELKKRIKDLEARVAELEKFRRNYEERVNQIEGWRKRQDQALP